MASTGAAPDPSSRDATRHDLSRHVLTRHDLSSHDLTCRDTSPSSGPRPDPPSQNVRSSV